MPVYDITGPDGRTVSVEGPTPPTEMEIDEIFASMGGGASKGWSTGAKVAGVGGLAALAAMVGKAAGAPGGLPGKAMAFGGQLNALRQQLMLSGMALPKSIAGGVGATVANAMERKSLAPLKSLLWGSGGAETVRDIGRSFKAGRQVGPAAGMSSDLPAGLDLPGRAMGAIDDAIRNSLVRSGVSDKEATRALLQAPLTGELGKVLEGKLARHVIPFRRTPFNQFTEGFRASSEHPAIAAGYGAVGAAQGAAQADEQFPLTSGVGVAASAKYGLPQAFGQIVGRSLAGGRGGGGVAGSALPVSEYGIETSLTDPLKPFEKPALVTLLEKAGLLPSRRRY